MQMQPSNAATLLCLLKPLTLLIIAIAGGKYFDSSLYMSDISTVVTEKQIELKQTVAWNTNASVP